MKTSDPFEAFLDREEYISQVAQNSGKVISRYGRVQTAGYGLEHFSRPIEFDYAFIEQPAVAYGFALTDPDVIEAMDTGSFPFCSGFVRKWQIDGKGLYRAAWVTVITQSVEYDDTGSAFRVDHSFTFTGRAIKAVLPDYADRAVPIPNEDVDSAEEHD